MLLCREKLIGNVLALFAIFMFHSPSWAEESPKRPQHNTDPSALNQYDGKLIRSISISIGEIFNEPDIGAPYRLVNSAKIQTREEVVRRELLFHEGEVFNSFLVSESERSLRDLGFLRNVETKVEADGEYVDVRVYCQDTWTLIPQLSFSSGDGRTRRTVGIAENNIAGYGKRLEILYEEDEGSESIETVWEDRRVWGSFHSLLLGAFDRNDGERGLIVFGRPFRSLVDKASWEVIADHGDTIGRLFRNGDERFIYRTREAELSGRYTFASGEPTVARNRLTFGYTYYDNDFSEATDEDFDDINLDPEGVSRDPALVADDRRYSGPVFTYSQVEPDFISMRYIDRFDRVEDFNLGEVYSASVFFAPSFLGSNDDYTLLSGLTSQGYRFSRYSFIRSELGGSARYSGEGAENVLGTFQSKYYYAFEPSYLGSLFLGSHTLAAHLRVDYGSDFDRNRELLLGGDTGLRGYKARTFTGDKRFLVNFEDRIHLIDDLYRLVSLGAAAFVDGGGTTNGPYGEIFSDNFYSDVGVGLRIGFPRSSRGRVLRIDAAWPLREGPDGSNDFEIRVIFSGGQIFDSLLLTDYIGRERSNVSVGYQD